MVVFKSETAKTEWLEDKKIVHLVQNGRNIGESLKQCLLKGTECLKKYNAYKWLSDNRELSSVRKEEDYEWINNVWTPDTIAAGWKKWALIQPKSALTATAEKKFVDFFASEGVEVKIFDNPEDGFAWLDSV
ncbi:MAG: hypothetical protein AAF518_00365 [Spirochaetota bacterium]